MIISGLVFVLFMPAIMRLRVFRSTMSDKTVLFLISNPGTFEKPR